MILMHVALVLGFHALTVLVLLLLRTLAVAARVVFRVAGLLFGGNWNCFSGCGSRSRSSLSSDIRSVVAPTPGGRGAS